MRSREGRQRAPLELQIKGDWSLDYKLDAALDQVIWDSEDVEGKAAGLDSDDGLARLIALKISQACWQPAR